MLKQVSDLMTNPHNGDILESVCSNVKVKKKAMQGKVYKDKNITFIITSKGCKGNYRTKLSENVSASAENQHFEFVLLTSSEKTNLIINLTENMEINSATNNQP